MDFLDHLKKIREKKQKAEDRKNEHNLFIDDFIKSLGKNVEFLSSGYVCSDNITEDDMSENFLLNENNLKEEI